MSLSSTVKVIVAGDVKGALKALDDLQGEARTTGSKLGNFAKTAALGFAGFAAAALAFGADAVRAGDKLNDSQDQLANTAGKLKLNVQGVADAVKGAVPHFEDYGVTQEQLTDSVNGFLRVGDSQTKALTDAQHAADLAATAHISYADASKAVIAGDEGKFRSLAKYLGPLKNANDLTKAYGKIQGSADISSKSLTGKTDALRAKFDDLKAHIGQQLIPILTSLASWFTDKVLPAIGVVVAWVQANWPKLTAAITPVLDTIVAYVQGFVSTVETLWSIFGGRIVSFAGKYFGSLKTAISGALQILESVFRLFADLVTGKWSKLWGDFVGIFAGLWKLVKAALGSAFTEITSVVSLAFTGIKNLASGAVGKVVGFVASIPGQLLGLAGSFLSAGAALGGHILSGLVNGISAAVSGAADIAKSLYNDFAGFVNAHVIDPIKNFGISVFGHGIHPFSSLPDIPKLHTGGIFNASSGNEGLALLQSGEGVFTADQMRALGSVGHRGGNVVINLPAGVSPSAVVAAQRRYDKRNGRAA